MWAQPAVLICCPPEEERFPGSEGSTSSGGVNDSPPSANSTTLAATDFGGGGGWRWKSKPYTRASCDRCVHLKRHCNGGRPVCNRCKAAVLTNCHYSCTRRRPNRFLTHKSAPAPIASVALVERVTLSQSPAVGLTGAENSYLRSFLACFGNAIPFGCTPSAIVATLLGTSTIPRTTAAAAAAAAAAAKAGVRAGATTAAAAPLAGGSAREILREGLAIAVLGLGAVMSGNCVNPSDHAMLMLRANLCIQRALEVWVPDGDDGAGGRS
ncbi:unnamed protein product, partial [Phaeothamnion confervicola]